MSRVVDALHGTIVHGRCLRRLGSLLVERLPARADVLDVGTGDGRLAARA